MSTNPKCETEYGLFLDLLEKIIYTDDVLETEFEDTKGDRPFRTEYAHESLTEKGSRYRRNRAEA